MVGDLRSATRGGNCDVSWSQAPIREQGALCTTGTPTVGIRRGNDPTGIQERRCQPTGVGSDSPVVKDPHPTAPNTVTDFASLIIVVTSRSLAVLFLITLRCFAAFRIAPLRLSPLLDFALLETIVALAAAYLIGSIDFGVIVPQLAGVDIYTHGSGNPGASNVLRTLGKKAGAAVMLGDVVKGMAAAGLGDLWLGEAGGFACGLAAVVGHAFPLWHRFRGGRGVATALGAAIWMEPWFGLMLVAAWAAVVAVTKMASLASLVAMVAYVPGFALFGHRDWSLLWAAAAALLVVVRHAPNIRRLLSGQERTVEAM